MIFTPGSVWKIAARRRGGVSIAPLLRKLLDDGVNRVFVEGGPTVAGVFLSERFADRVGRISPERRAEVLAFIGDELIPALDTDGPDRVEPGDPTSPEDTDAG